MGPLEKKLRRAIIIGLADYQDAVGEYAETFPGESEQPNVVKCIYLRIKEVLRAQKSKPAGKRTR